MYVDPTRCRCVFSASISTRMRARAGGRATSSRRNLRLVSSCNTLMLRSCCMLLVGTPALRVLRAIRRCRTYFAQAAAAGVQATRSPAPRRDRCVRITRGANADDCNERHCCQPTYADSESCRDVAYNIWGPSKPPSTSTAATKAVEPALKAAQAAALARTAAAATGAAGAAHAASEAPPAASAVAPASPAAAPPAAAAAAEPPAPVAPTPTASTVPLALIPAHATAHLQCLGQLVGAVPTGFVTINPATQQVRGSLVCGDLGLRVATTLRSII